MTLVTAARRRTIRPMLAARGIGIALVVAAAMVAAGWFVLSSWQSESQQQQSANWERQLATLDERRAAAVVRSLRQHDELAIATLVLALSDRRPLVSAAARESIGNLVADWGRLPARDAVPRLSKLAGAMADRYEGLEPSQQQFARHLAQRLLLWPLEDADFPADELVARCERILDAPAPVLPDVAPEIAAETPADAESESLPPIVTPQIATRPSHPAPPTATDPPVEQEPAPVADPPALVAPGDNLTDSSSNADDARPVQPRQFIRPRVPHIPRPDQP